MGISALLASQILDASATGRSVLTGVDASAIRTTLGLGTLATQSPTGTPSASTFLRGDFSWQTIDLSGYVPYTGATGAVNLGSNAFTASSATLATGTITASSPAINVSQTWNNAAVAFNALSIAITDTASDSLSTSLDISVSGQPRLRHTVKNTRNRLSLFSRYAGSDYEQWYAEVGTTNGYGGFVSCPGGFMESLTNSPGAFLYISTFASSNYRQWYFAAGSKIKVGQSTTIEWYGADYRADINTSDLILLRDAANTLGIRNSTNAQRLNLYGTYTDASNYERAKIAWESNVLRIGTEKAGTGSARALELQTDGTTRLTIGTTGTFTIADALNIATGTTTGTKIGTGTTQKLGFYNATPVVQPTAVADATDAASVITQLNALLSRMRDLGLIAT